MRKTNTELSVVAEPAQVIVMGAEIRFELGVVRDGHVIGRETFSAGFMPLNEEGVAKALEEALKKKAELQAAFPVE